MSEWPSDEDSGIKFELRSFNEQQAREMLAEHPEIRQPGQSETEATHFLHEKLLLTLTICWQIGRSSSDAAILIELPKELQHD